jgi:tetrapyrrole methylase family protein/MazG family protein
MPIDQIDRLIRLIETLRGEEGCPWDKQQTSRSMAVYLVEEVYELVDAIESGNIAEICEELGDVLFQILFIACIYQEKGDFTLGDAARESREKMIRRHPHVFGDENLEDAEQVRRQWRRIKKEEQGKAEKSSILDSIPRKLPALMRAYRISERAGGKGFDWDDIHGVVEKTEEEWTEFKHELERQQAHGNNRERLAMEFGDVLFTLVNVARFARFHPETALTDATRKFEMRFRHMEKMIQQRGQGIDTVERCELERLWAVSKNELG